MKRTIAIFLVAGVMGFVAYYGVQGARVAMAVFGGGYDRLSSDFQPKLFDAMKKGDMDGVKRLANPAIAQSIADQLNAKGLAEFKGVWFYRGLYPAPNGRPGTAFYGLKAKDKNGVEVEFRFDLDQFPAKDGEREWRITGLSFDTNY